MKRILSFIALLFILILSSCENPGTTKKFEGFDGKTIQPCVIDGDTIDLYKYYYLEGNSIWIAKFRNGKEISSLNYSVGKSNESVILINGNAFRRITGDIICENDSIIVIRRN